MSFDLPSFLTKSRGKREVHSLSPQHRAPKIEPLGQVARETTDDASGLRQALTLASTVFLVSIVVGVTTSLYSAGSGLADPPGYSILPPEAANEIVAVGEELDRTEAAALALVGKARLDRYQQITTLGKLLLFDKNLSINRNEAFVFCHMPETGWTGPVSALNATTSAYPGSVRTRFRQRAPQAYGYATFAPPLYYDPNKQDLVGGNFLGHARLGRSPWQPVRRASRGAICQPGGDGFSRPSLRRGTSVVQSLSATVRGRVGHRRLRRPVASGCRAELRPARSAKLECGEFGSGCLTTEAEQAAFGAKRYRWFGADGCLRLRI